MLKVAADPHALGEDVHCRFRGARCVVIEEDTLVDPVANRDGALPALRNVAEEVLGDGAELVDLAVAAGKQELEDLGGEVVDGRLLGVGINFVGLGAGFDQVGSGEPEVAGGRDEAGTAIAEGVEVVARGNDGLGVAGGRRAVIQRVVEGFDDKGVFGAQEGVNGRMQVQQRDDRSRCGQAELNVEL